MFTENVGEGYTNTYGSMIYIVGSITGEIDTSNNIPVPRNPMNNAELTGKNAMPLKDSTTDGSSSFSMGRMMFVRGKDLKETDNKKWYGNNADNQRRAHNGHLHHRLNFPNTVLNALGTATSFTTNNSINVQRQAVNRTRNGGATVPAKVAMNKPPL